ncbi:exopolyphosphatase PRUNE1-like isoform X2 [Centropristis striata]|uniref:exopolyphosphatase PRUNE1-like isoform X2 n=1 Tax=Centropristis striata TaxID=184440 RepID=UPI0027DF20C8|nr:exopolyphosphatase PRUNE1-like isoform X2 [Centropristis striata]
MEDFLESSSAAAKTRFHGSQRVHVVMGNESCDLDSIVSSLAMAYFLSRSSSGLRGASLVLPVLNVPRSLFPLRRDAVLLLTESGVATETLVFRDEVDLHRLHGDGRLALTLVDAQSGDAVLQAAAVDVIDHVETVASCVTLVTERILSRAPEILDRQLALLLYGVMVDSVGRTVRDRQVIRLLQTQFPDLPPEGALHAALHAAKFDLSEQILLQDLVSVAVGGETRIAVSNVYMSLNEFLLRTSLQQELSAACQSHRLDAVVAMTTSFSDQSEEPVRQLAVYSSRPQHRLQISHALLTSRSPALCFSSISCPYKDILAFDLTNAGASRRRLLLLLSRLLSDDTITSSSSSVLHHRRRLQLGADGYGSLEEEEEESWRRAPPPPPMNSLVDGSPLEGGFNQEALLEKFSRMGGGEEEEQRGRRGL